MPKSDILPLRRWPCWPGRIRACSPGTSDGPRCSRPCGDRFCTWLRDASTSSFPSGRPPENDGNRQGARPCRGSTIAFQRTRTGEALAGRSLERPSSRFSARQTHETGVTGAYPSGAGSREGGGAIAPQAGKSSRQRDNPCRHGQQGGIHAGFRGMGAKTAPPPVPRGRAPAPRAARWREPGRSTRRAGCKRLEARQQQRIVRAGQHDMIRAAPFAFHKQGAISARMASSATSSPRNARSARPASAFEPTSVTSTPLAKSRMSSAV